MGAHKHIDGISKPNVFDYHDYVDFLQDLFAYKREIDSRFSLRKLAKKCHLSNSYFSMVLGRKTSLSQKVLLDIEQQLELSQQELSYLAHLLQLNNAKTLAEQKNAYRKIKKFAAYRSKNLVGMQAHLYLSSWLNVAIREMSHLPNFEWDDKWIYKRLYGKATKKQIREAMDFLVEIDCVQFDRMGRPKPSGKSFHIQGPVFKLALTEYYEQILNKAIEAVYAVDRENRDFNSNTVALSKEGFQKVKDILNEAMNQIDLAVAEDKKDFDEVYHISYFAFPFTKEVD